MDKQAIRVEFLKKRKDYTYSQEMLTGIFSHTEQFIKSLSSINNIAGYYPTSDEMDILPLLNQLKKQYQILLPRIVGNSTMHFCSWDDELEKSPRYRFYQPKAGEEVVPDVMIVPVVTCDANGHRLGYGKGYYDRYLSSNKGIIKIGLIPTDLIYSSKLPNEAHDIKLEYIITENGVIRAKQ